MSNLPVEIVESHGLRLREVRESDLNDIVAACNDPDIRAYLCRIPIPYTRSDAQTWATAITARTRADGGASFVVADLVTDRLAGTLGLHRDRPDDERMSVGYWVAPWARHKGFATNATRAATEWAFKHQMVRLELIHRLDNEAGMRVAMAAGFTHEGVRRCGAPTRGGGRADMAVWSRLATDSGESNPPELPDLPGGQLTDGVVTLTPLTSDDADSYFAIAQLPEVIATTISSAPVTRERVAHRCAEARYRWLLGHQAQLVIRDGSTGAFAGLISLMNEGITKQGMLGYDVTRESRGRGFAPRAVRLLTDWAFDVAGIERLVAGTAPDNTASQRVLEKAGFKREGFERARLPKSDGSGRVDNVAWALLPGDRR